jgi:hypothetical protein
MTTCRRREHPSRPSSVVDKGGTLKPMRSREYAGWTMLAFTCSLMLVARGQLRISNDAHRSAWHHGLPKLLTITWRKGPDLPQGFQDSAGGVVGDMLITVGGFTQGQTQGVVNKRGRYPREFLNRGWGLNLNSQQGAWQPLPAFPGPARQGLSGAVIRDQFYVWGGFSYSPPYTYKDGYPGMVVNGNGIVSRIFLGLLPFPELSRSGRRSMCQVELMPIRS